MRLLLVEDDPLLGDGLRVGLRQAGYAVDWVEDGQTAKFSLQSENYDLAVLDLGLPKIPGLELLKWLRAQAMTLPVLLLTARDTISDRVTGLDAGADDYLIKPFDLDELIARLRALSRRGSGLATPLLTYREISLDPAAHQVFKNDTLVELSAREFSLLHQLLLNIGRVQTRDQ
ncbi:two component transcriptional regulator, winged helix family, partial [mine drainage metagenome]